jgi:hypothetical protein
MPHPTSIAGRHAADRQRARAAEAASAHIVDAQFEAAAVLAFRLQRSGLQTCADILPHRPIEPTLGVRCRIDHCEADHSLIYAILDELGWKTDPKRLSRVNARYDILRLVHAASGATLVLIITLPAYQVGAWEAA